MGNTELRQWFDGLRAIRHKQLHEMLRRETGEDSLSPEYAVYLRQYQPALFLALLSQREKRKLPRLFKGMAA